MTILISHIPKTAGTSLKSLICSNSPGAIFSYNAELSLLRPNLDFIKTFRDGPPPPIVMGHFSYGAHRYLGVEPKYVTVLRNPVDRVVSLYTHQKKLYPEIFKNISIIQYVSACKTEMTNNHACRIIAGISPDVGLVINDRWILELAIHNITRHYVLVGLIEYLKDFQSGLFNILEWPHKPMPVLNSASGSTIPIDLETRKLILNFNRLDMELYEYILQSN